MLRTTLRIITFSLATSLVFCVASVVLGYLAIVELDLYAPNPIRSEWASHMAVLGFEAVTVFVLSAIALGMAWDATKSTPRRPLVGLACASGVGIAILQIVEDIPRKFAPWLAFLLPVIVVITIFATLKRMAVRRSNATAMSTQHLERP